MPTQQPSIEFSNQLDGSEGELSAHLLNSIKYRVERQFNITMDVATIRLLCDGIAAALIPHLISRLQTPLQEAIRIAATLPTPPSSSSGTGTGSN